ncbi:MAG TPA: hypothetical protein VF547_08920 [Allosphingosinicella sp.]|jgi:hypothetical protein
MAATADIEGGRPRNRWRPALWGGAALLLLAPAVATRFTDEMNWGPGDFLHLAALLAAACAIFELLARTTDRRAYRAGAGVALATGVLLIWINLAVGIIGTEDNRANLMFAGVLLVAVLGAALARGRAEGMARALAATAAAQAAAGAAALAAGWGASDPSWPFEIIGLTGLFAAAWLLAAWLFRRSLKA